MTAYSFVSIPLLQQREGLVFASDYQEIIRDRAAEGWDFVQLISLEHHTEPRCELVFTRKERSA